jgi:hypothetical protein
MVSQAKPSLAWQAKSGVMDCHAHLGLGHVHLHVCNPLYACFHCPPFALAWACLLIVYGTFWIARIHVSVSVWLGIGLITSNYCTCLGSLGTDSYNTWDCLRLGIKPTVALVGLADTSSTSTRSACI